MINRVDIFLIPAILPKLKYSTIWVYTYKTIFKFFKVDQTAL